MRKMRENLVWAVGYNVFTIPLAAGVGMPFGIILSPAIAAVVMTLSTVIVAVNAMHLQRILTRGKKSPSSVDEQ